MKTLPKDASIQKEWEQPADLTRVDGKLDIINDATVIKISEARIGSQGVVENLLAYIYSETDESKSEIYRTLKAKDFIYQHKLIDAYDAAIEKVQEFIPGIESIAVSFRNDVDTNESWVEIKMFSTSTPDEIIDAEDQFLDAWLPKFPRKESDLIRFDYEIVS